MRLIDKLVMKDMIGPFITGLMMFLILIFAAAYLFPATELIVKGVPVLTVAKLTMFSLPSVVTQVFPMAMLLAGLLAFGRLSSDSEIVAVFAAGVSFARASRAVILMGALVSVIAFFWNDLVVPPAMTAYWNLKQDATNLVGDTSRALHYEIDNKSGNGLEEFVSIARGYNPHTRTLRGVTITRYSQDPAWLGQIEAVIYCDRAVANDQTGLNWTYYNGYLIAYAPDRHTGYIDNVMPVYFRELKSSPKRPEIGMSFDEALNAQVTDSNRLTFRQLRKSIREDTQMGRLVQARGEEVDLYGKIALPLASLIVSVVGAALGVNTRRGGGKTVGFGAAFFIVFVYWVVYHAMFVVGKNGALPPLLASFLADIIGLVVGAILMVRASS